MVSAAERQGLNDLECFGLELREAREGRKLTQSQLGDSSGYSKSYVSKVESGAVVPSEAFALKCDLALGTHGFFARQRRRALAKGHPRWFAPYARLEKSATEILHYSTSVVMGLLQTEAYAYEVYRAARPRDPETDIRGRVERRRERRTLLSSEAPPVVWVVLHEACLRTVQGNVQVMRDQLASLLEDAQRPEITIQVLPFDKTPPCSETFTLLRFSDHSAILYADTIMSGQLSDSSTDVPYAASTYDLLRAEALPPAESICLIRTIMEACDARL